MDPMKRVAAGAVRKNLGPDPSMGQKVELLRRLVAMRGAPKRKPMKPAQFAGKPGYNFGPPKGM